MNIVQALNVDYLKNSTPEQVEKVPWIDLQIMMERWTQQLEVAHSGKLSLSWE